MKDRANLRPVTNERLLQLRQTHEAVPGHPMQCDAFRRMMEPHLVATGTMSEGHGADPRRFSGSKADMIAMTLEAMDAGAPLVLGGRLPDDVDGGRTGRPDILVKFNDGYLPADVKNHLTLTRSKVKSADISALAAPHDDPSAALTVGRLGTREWLTLRRMGVTTTAALSAVDPDDPVFFDEYAAEVSHVTPTVARKRLVGAIERAEMISEGIEIKRTGDGPVDVPVADIEIDVDIDYDLDNKVYLWGARLRRDTDDSTARYVADFVDWEPLDSPRKHTLAARFADWVREQRETANANGETLKVFHWSSPERSKLKSILGPAEVEDLVDSEAGVFVDLRDVFDANFVSLHGSSIKKVARSSGSPGGSTIPVVTYPRLICPKCTPAPIRTKSSTPNSGC